MVYLAWALLAFLGCALFGLFWLDLSPRAAFQKVLRRFVTLPVDIQAMPSGAPYRQAAYSRPAHRPTLLNLETSDGSGQACHPDVVYVPRGFGAEGWQYWLACTPYPYANSSFENPEIFVSHDGVSWMVPYGLENPLVSTPRNDGSHNSDPDLVLRNGELWLYYRETLRSQRPGIIPDQNRIFVKKTTDGIRWSKPVEVLSDATGRQILSPSVIYERGFFRMWTVELEGGPLRLVQRVSRDGVLWSAPQACTVLRLKGERQPWHIDVAREGDSLRAILVSCTGLGGKGCRIHYAYSDDDGQSWVVSGFLFDQGYDFESKLQYRASLQLLDASNSEYGLWYSAASTTDVFSIAYLRMRRVGDQLVPSSTPNLNRQERALVAAK